MTRAPRLLLLAAALAAAAGGRPRPTRCIGGGGRITLCIDASTGYDSAPQSYQPRRYDYGGLYGPEYFRHKFAQARPVYGPPAGARPPPRGYGRGYGYAFQPGFRLPLPETFVFRVPSRPVFGPVATGYGHRYGYAFHGQPAFRPQFAPAPRPLPVVPAVVPRPYPVVPQPRPAVPRPLPVVPAVVPRPYPVVPQPRPAVPRPPVLVPQPYQPAARPFYIRPHVSGPQFPPHPDIRSFYNAATLIGRGRVSADNRKNVQFVCDFALAGVHPATDVLTDVVWQKVGHPVYMNNPMTSISGFPNLLSCPTAYVSPTPTNYGFNIAGSKTTLVIKNATPSDYGVYRCYATRVSRLNPRHRVPVYMEVYFSPGMIGGKGGN